MKTGENQKKTANQFKNRNSETINVDFVRVPIQRRNIAGVNIILYAGRLFRFRCIFSNFCLNLEIQQQFSIVVAKKPIFREENITAFE